MRTPAQDDLAATKLASELADLERRTEHARAELARVEQDLVDATSHFDSTVSAQLLLANEQLMVAALRSQSNEEASTRALEELTRSSELDALTELPNRNVLLDRLTHAMGSAKRRGARVAVLFLDLNNFKQVNDTLGHAVGDEVLRMAARCLVSSVREVDTVSRHGGDEFVVLLTEVSQASDASLVAEKVRIALGSPTRMGEHVLRLSASIGISLYPDDGEDAASLISRADAAMYRAKRSGLGAPVFHRDAGDGPHRLTAPALDALLRPLTHYEIGLAENERRYAELREANTKLVLAALSAQDREAAAEKLRQRQTEFMATLAHELRGPLAPIRSSAALLGHARMQEFGLPKLRGIIERQVAQMARIVDDLLDVSRAHTGKLRLQFGFVDISDVVNDAVESCRPGMDTRLQDFHVRMPAAAVQVWGDRVRLVQVLGNLLGNACKYTPDKGVIHLSVELASDAVVITVTDSGIGISADILPHIFEPFVQDAHAVGFNGMGLGIGLAVVRELVEAHGGTVVASSAGSHLGSRFVVRMPLRGLHAPDDASDPAL